MGIFHCTYYMKYINLSNNQCSKIGIELENTIPDYPFLDYALGKGINLFSTAAKNTEIIDLLGKWIRTKEKSETIIILLHIKINPENIDAFLPYILDLKNKLNTNNIIIHIADIQEITETVNSNLAELRTLVLNKGLLGLGIRTHKLGIAQELILKNITTLEIPINAVEHGLYLSVKNLILETGVIPIAIKPFGDGDLFIDSYPPSLLFNSVYSLIWDTGMVVFPLSCKEEIDEIVYYESHYMEGIHPIIEDFCNKCQLCEKTCMNGYPIARYIKYCKDIDSFNKDVSDWAKTKLINEAVTFDCIGCSQCEAVCPLHVPIRKFVKEHLPLS